MNFATLDLNLLRVLDMLLREGSTTRAGQRLGLSQPAVSAALGRLRHATGDPLFVRQGNRLAPTDYASDLAGPLRAALDGLQDIMAPEVFNPARAETVFCISGGDFFAEFLMPPLARRLSDVAPNVRIRFVDVIPDDAFDRMEREEIDLALMPVGETPEWIDSQPLFSARFVVAARPGHPRLVRHGLRPGDTIPIDLFCDLSHVLMSTEGKLTAMGDAALAKVGRSRRVVMSLPIFNGVSNIVASSDLVALLPVQIAHGSRMAQALEFYEAPFVTSIHRIGMIWHSRATTSPAHRWLRQEVAGILEPLDEMNAR